jgi:hypothetical protein
LGKKLFEMGNRLLSEYGSREQLETLTTESKAHYSKLVLISTNPKFVNHWWPLEAKQQVERMDERFGTEDSSVCRKILTLAIDDLSFWAHNNADTALDGDRGDRLKACFGK